MENFLCVCGKRTNLNYKTKHWKLLRKLVLRVSARARVSRASTYTVIHIRFEFAKATCELAQRRDKHTRIVRVRVSVSDSISVLFVAYIYCDAAKWIRPGGEGGGDCFPSQCQVHYWRRHSPQHRFSSRESDEFVSCWRNMTIDRVRIKKSMFDTFVVAYVCRWFRSHVIQRMRLVANVILILWLGRRADGAGTHKNVFA